MPQQGNNKKPHNRAKYILYVGTRQYYKNFAWMLESITGFLKEQNMLLACAGGGNFIDSEKELIEVNKLQSRVLFYDIHDDHFLNQLYRDAFCFVFPSLYEGFGLPILEAFANNCPDILTNASCFPEIAGNAALYFEVDKPESLNKQLAALVFEKDLRNELVNAATQRLKNFGWEKMVDQHKKVYRSVTHA